MQIGELSRRTGVSVRMLRYYEREHLLRPARRTSGYRDYGEEDVRLVERIRALSAAASPSRPPGSSCPASTIKDSASSPARTFARRWKEEMRRISEKIATLETSRQILTDYLSEAG